MDSVKKKGPVFQKVFEFCYNYKLSWCRSGKRSPIIDAVVFNKVRYTKKLEFRMFSSNRIVVILLLILIGH